MAYDKIIPIRHRMVRCIDYVLNEDKTDLANALQYTENPAKTQRLVTGVNCTPETALEEMNATKRRWDKTGGVLGYHIIHSYSPGEVTPEQAHAAGVELAERLLGERYEAVVSTHLDREHLHCHIVFNSVSFLDGKKYRDDFKSYFEDLRGASNEVSRKHGLSVIEPGGHGKHYAEWSAERSGKGTIRGLVRQDIDADIAESFTFDTFLAALRRQGYTIKYGASVTHTAVRPPGGERFLRLDSMGAGYSEADIRARLTAARNGEASEKPPEVKTQTLPMLLIPDRHRRYTVRQGVIPIAPRRKLRGFRALYLRYVYLLNGYRRPQRALPSFAVRKEVAKLQRYDEQARFLMQYRIDTDGQLSMLGDALQGQIDLLLDYRKELYKQRRDGGDVDAELADVNRKLRATRRELTICRHIINPSIRERPRRAAVPKEKPAGGAFQPKTKDAALTAVQPETQTGATPPRTTKTPPAAAKSRAAKAPTGTKAAGRSFIVERGRKQAQRDAQRQILRQSKKAARTAAEAGKKLAVATVKTAEGLITALAGLLGGGTLIAILCVLGLIAAIIASPFGILLANAPSPGAVPLNTAVARIRMELNSALDDAQAGDYDDIDITGDPPDWREVVAVFAAKTTGAKDGVDVAALTPDRVNRLRAVFWDMCSVTSEVETVAYPDSDPDDEVDDSYSETLLHITITPKSIEEMRGQYRFTVQQNEALDELLAELPALDTVLEDLAVSEKQARTLVLNLPSDLAPERRAVVEAACQLVGKVTYFWGGKSLALGWDDRWGTLQKVWAEGHRTTGTYQAYGLDCSGFVDWAFYNASNGAYYPGHGGGTYMQRSHCTPVSWTEAQPGDLVFTADVGHVGIVGGRDEAGNLLIVHCFNSVGITDIGEFTIVGRPDCFSE